MNKLEQAAKAVFEMNATVKKVYVTEDGNPFYIKDDAMNHAKTLDSKEVVEISRESLKVEPAATGVKLKAEELIALINEAETAELVDEVLGSDKRKTVLEAAENRKKILLEASTEDK